MLIVLLGPPKSGKSSVGKILADKLGIKFIDTDRLIEERCKLPIREVYLNPGENEFRKKEKEIIDSIKTENAIIALGGGVQEVNIEDCKKIYLETNLENLWQRVETLPAYLTGPDFKGDFFSMINKRLPAYEKIADTTINTDNKTPEEVAEKIIKEIKNGCK